MNISSLHVAGVFLAGVLSTSGYFIYQAIVPNTLENHIRVLGLKLADSTNWSSKAEEYKKKYTTYSISTISDPNNSDDVVRKLKDWCGKKKDKYFLGEANLEYQKFSVLCLVTESIENVLNNRGKKKLNSEQKVAKVESYNAVSNKDKFIENKPNSIVEQDLTNWCNKKTAEMYEHEGIESLKKVIKWCYSK